MDYLKQAVVRELVAYLMEGRGINLEQAMGIVSRPSTMSKVLNERTGLYSESPAYVYEFLKEELGAANSRKSGLKGETD